MGSSSSKENGMVKFENVSIDIEKCTDCIRVAYYTNGRLIAMVPLSLDSGIICDINTPIRYINLRREDTIYENLGYENKIAIRLRQYASMKNIAVSVPIGVCWTAPSNGPAYGGMCGMTGLTGTRGDLVTEPSAPPYEELGPTGWEKYSEKK